MPPLLVTAAIIVDDQKLLLVKRARDPFKGYWSFVSGCEAFEYTADPSEAVQQEVKGDLTCRFNPTFFRYNYECFDDKPSVVLYFTGPISGNPIANPQSVPEYRWFSFDEARKLKLGYDHSNILEQFLREYVSR